MKVIIQLQLYCVEWDVKLYYTIPYSLTDSKVFHDVKNITQSSLHPTQPNPTHGWTQPMTNSVSASKEIWEQREIIFVTLKQSEQESFESLWSRFSRVARRD